MGGGAKPHRSGERESPSGVHGRSPGPGSGDEVPRNGRILTVVTSKF